ncbi:uncharacterized protein LOC131860054 [Cryptomeria japonica]|uniref:uncharacterized protein LOC131860054 n=1 Tax=Cryptomeria japonica TaxID=3369 RepID=UPI0027DA0593|nr:uncharacterized protein LOC131860054 [Cryptomeria japonica]
MIVWQIWKERNKRIFKEISNPIAVVISNLKASIEEALSGKSKNVRKLRLNDWDLEMEKIWSFKNVICHYPNKKIDRKQARWTKPHYNWVKLNFDGACRGNPGQAGYGAVIRDEVGNIVASTYGQIGHTTNNDAKIRALMAGLLLCKNKGLTNVQIEGDSQIIINGIINSRFTNWQLARWLPRIHNLLHSIKPYEISHIYREGNRLADLANLGVMSDKVDVTVDPESISSKIKELNRMDLMERNRVGIG